ncbi:hypothetical protein MNBD_BACTEROID01-829 [hydrothermal vent metagenome]|uniref:Uncharacterized protein n=1 Tax=hydrothermal vent metagenome TaxID=652676 RepID=A0A3B0UET9_9ZZZZ
MRNYSTFIYLIKYSQPGQVESEEIGLDAGFEELLVEMGNEDFSPSNSSIDMILSFACSYDTLETKETGLIEMNLN